MSDFDELAVQIVCVERVPMRLRRQDRVEAARRLSAVGVVPGEIGRLVMTRPDAMARVLRNHGITPAAPVRAWWWSHGMSEHEMRRRLERGRELRRQRRERQKQDA